MAYRFMTDPVTNRCALFLEAPGVASEATFTDPISPINAPLNNPTAWLSNVVFHSDFDYFQVAAGPTNVTINHAGLSPVSQALYPLGNVVGASATADTALFTHNLGYVPPFRVVIGNTVISPATIVQQDGSGSDVRTRSVTPYATTTQIRILETMLVNLTALAAGSVTYTVVVFKQPVENAGEPLFDKTTSFVKMARGKFDSSLKMLRRSGIAGDSPWDIPLGPTIDISNGQRKEVTASGAVHAEPYYDGSFAGSPSFQGVVA